MRRGAALPLHAVFYLNMSKIITIAIAGTKINIELLFEETGSLFREFLSDYDAGAPLTGMSGEEFAAARRKYPDHVSVQVIEFNELLFKVCKVLLDCGMPTFHGTAFIWNEKAWIFTGPSGAGKSTQYFLWKILFKDQIRLLNGDKTVLRPEADGSITVFSTPWAGKEGMSRMESAPLEGIIFLSQDSENRIEPLNLREASKMFSPQFIFVDPSNENVLTLNRTFRAMLGDVSLWRFRNKGDMDSARLAHDTILKSR